MDKQLAARSDKKLHTGHVKTTLVHVDRKKIQIALNRG